MKIIEVYPTKAQFNCEDEITFVVEIEGYQFKNLILKASVTYLDTIIKEKDFIINKVSGKLITEINLGLIDQCHGFGLCVNFEENNQVVETARTAFDIVQKHSDSIRYGFLSDFFTTEENNDESLKWLNKLHINYIQYYDWMYKHDQLVPPEDTFTDLLDRNLSKKTIQARIQQARKYGMKNIAYGAIYGATDETYLKYPEWALYKKSKEPISFNGFLYIMNINEKSGWQNHIINEYKNAIEFGFDGIHMDTYGAPKTGVSYDGEIQRLGEQFSTLINNTKKKLSQIKNDVSLILNNVGNWPVDTVAEADQEAIYIEVWDPYYEYSHLREIIENAKQHNKLDKPIILAAYLKPFEGQDIPRSENAALLLTATITTLGSSHLILGEKNGIITEGYYPKYYRNTNETFNQKIRKYYDHIVQFKDIWFNPDLRDVSRTHYRGDNKEYIINGVPCSPNPEAGKMWVTIKESPQLKVLSFINLSGVKDTIWNKEKDIEKSNEFNVSIQTDSDIEGVFFTSPESYNPIVSIDYTWSKDGNNIQFTVPDIEVWGTVVIKC